MQHLMSGITHKKLKQRETDVGLDVIEVDNQFCNAVIAVQGAQVLHYQQKHKAPVLWLSEAHRFQPTKAVRGGIPICFPWFGGHPTQPDLPSHGFARNRLWQLQDVTVQDDEHLLLFQLDSSDETYALWPHHFQATLQVRLGAQLQLTFSVLNKDQHAFDFSFALHSYFNIQDIHQTQVRGLLNTPFLDQLNPEKGDQQCEAQPISFTAEMDRIYQQAQGSYQIVSPLEAPIHIESTGCSSVVVWNPWAEKSARLGDIATGAWQNMLCVECGCVAAATVSLAAGQRIEYQMAAFRD